MSEGAHSVRVIVWKGDRLRHRVDFAGFGAWLLLAEVVARVVGSRCDERFVVKVSGYCVARPWGSRGCGSAATGASVHCVLPKSAASTGCANHTSGKRYGFAHDAVKFGTLVAAADVLHDALRGFECAVWAPWAEETAVAVQAWVGRGRCSDGGCMVGGGNP